MIRIPRLAFLGVFILLMCAFFAFVGWPIALWWLLLIPVGVGVWVQRTQTTVSAEGLDLRTVLGKRHLDWSQLKGVRIPKRGYVRADLVDGGEVKLPAVSYDRVRELANASGGRIPDPFAQPSASSTAKATGSEKADATTADANDSAEEAGTGATTTPNSAGTANGTSGTDTTAASAVDAEKTDPPARDE
ncbi:hypothetical protein GCM10023318_46220 [Nocardia callitridis]|uniref:Low molecular weight protein antigen 6 PH domain-containing protein n=1 Tax=Nocardia callitridis TaxID=648753 RepID=A0ABP9KRV4_9NOCA